MIKLAKYLKPFSLKLILAVILLFGQAISDLYLPNIMSKIINIGIQQSGISQSYPEAVSTKGFDLLYSLMDQNEKAEVSKSYTLIKKNSEESGKYIIKYPLLKTEDIYVLNSNFNENNVNNIFSRASTTLINILKYLSSQNGSSNNTIGNMNVNDEDFSKLYSIIPVIKRLPNDIIKKQIVISDNTPESSRNQIGTAIIKGFYNEVGLNVSEIQTNYILKTGLLMLLITLLGIIAAILISYFASQIAAGVSRNLRKDIFSRVESYSNTEFDHFSTASLITRTTNDVMQIQTVIIMGIRMLIYAPIMGVGGTIMALRDSFSMSWIIVLAVILTLFLIIYVFFIATPKFKVIQKLVDKLNLVSRENLSGQLVIRAFSSQIFEENRFDKINMSLTRNTRFVNRVMSFMMPSMMLIMNFITLIIVWVGASQISNSTIQVGDMMAFMQYAMQIIMSFIFIAVMFIMVPRAQVSAIRISEVLETNSSINNPTTFKPLDKNKSGLIEFKDVSFRYKGATEDVLSNITFTAKPNQTTAFIGPTGAGKTTLINLIPRFYDVTNGKIFVSGDDVKNISLDELRMQIGYVPQKGMLMKGTIESNLKYGKQDATNEEIKFSAETAQALEFINDNELGFGYSISQEGANVSGGQKQRLSIARALVRKPSIYIFDDSFSALDFKTDANLRRALKDYTKNSTVLIVAQRISTIINADQIIVLDNGEIVGVGTHHELLKTCSVYYEIASSQLSKEEL